MAGSLRILILEDNAADAELIQFELQEAGFNFTAKVVMTEGAYTQAIQDYYPDLILSDYDLPKYNGSLALAEAGRRCPDTPFILVTGAVTEDRAIEILTQGAKDYVLKSRLQQRLISAVRRALAEAEEHRARKRAENELREAHRTLEEKVKIRTAELEAEIATRMKTQEALQESESVLRAFFDSPGMLRGIVEVMDGDIRYVSVSKPAAAVYGLTPDAVSGKLFSEMGVPPGILHAYRDRCEESRRTGLSVSFEMLRRLADGDRCLLVTASYLGTGLTGYPRFAYATVDITERKLQEEERERVAHLITVVNTPGDFRERLSNLTASLQGWSGCEAVGIRLRSGDDYPYYGTRGFPPAFVQEENQLCSYSPDGKILRDGDGNPVLECMCGNILSGRFDPAKPFFTAHGSFWSNNTTALLASTTEADRQARTRNRCNGEGYESVALIPLRTGDQVFGLLQFNDHRPNRFTSSLIDHYERIADNLAIALSQRQAEEALRESEDRYRKLFNNNHTVMLIIDPDDTSIKDANPAACSFYGWSREELIRRGIDEINTLTKEEIVAEIELARSEQRNHFFFKHRRADGTIRDVDVYTGPIIMGGKTHLFSIIHDITERKQMEAKLKNSEEKFRVSFMTSSDAYYWSTLEEGLILEINPVFEDVFGYTRDETIGKTSLQLGLYHDPADRAQMLSELKAKGSVKNLELKGRKKSGEIITILLSVNKILINNEHYILGVIEDITERKQIKEEFHEMTERLHLATASAKAGVWDWNLQTNEMIWDDRMLELYGLTHENFPGGIEAWEQGLHPDDSSKAIEECQAALRGERDFDTEFRVRRPDETVVHIKANGLVLRGEAGKPLRMIGLNTEITERKQAEEALQKSEAKYRLLLENAPDAIYVHADAKFIYLNRAAVNLFGAETADQLIGCSIMDRYHQDYHRMITKRLHDLYEEHKILPITEQVYLRLNGTSVPVEAHAIPIIYSDQHAALTFARDITDRKQRTEEKRSLEERLQRAEKMQALGQLAGGVAHDLNNVLGVSTIYSELLQEKIPEDSPLRKYVDNILTSTQKGAAIIADLLTLARRGVVKTDVINLNSIVSSFLKAPEYEKLRAYHPNVTFRAGCQAELLNIKGSSVHLEKTLMNLISNAAEAISGKGEVTVRTENRYLDAPVRGYDAVSDGDYVVLTVSDTGTGISAESIGKIFEPFYTKKTMGRSGTGLGLAIVWGTVKDHNGYIDVQTELGRGTTFTLYFPVTREERFEKQQKVPIEQYMGNGESVLVVDDIAEQRDVAARLLTRLGYQVHTVSCGEEAVKYLKGNTANILVLDMIMPSGIDGLETYQRVQEISATQKAILVSGFSETERVQEAQRLGAGAYVKKPYVMETIGVAIRDELKRK